MLAALGVAIGGGCAKTPQFSNSLDTSYAAEIHGSQELPGNPQRDQQFAGPQGVSQLIQFAAGNHPEVLAAALRLQAAEAALEAAGQLRDPRLTIGIPIEPVETAAGPQDASLGVSQEVPRLAKLERRWALAEAKRDVAQFEFEQVRERVTRRIRIAYASFYRAVTETELVRQQQELQQQVARIAAAKYRTNQISQSEWQTAELTVDRFEQQRMSLQREGEAARAELLAAVGLHIEVPLQATPRLPDVSLPADKATYRQLALERNLTLLGSAAMMRAKQIAAELECLERRPDPTLSATWIGVGDRGLSPVANGQDSVLLGVSLRIPVFRGQDTAEARQAAALAREQIQEHRRLKLEQISAVEAQHDAARLLASQLGLLDSEMLPAARQIYETGLRDFESGRLSYDRLSDYQQRLFELQRQRAELDAARFIAVAKLTELLGGATPATPEEANAPADNDSFPPPNGPPAAPPEALPSPSARRNPPSASAPASLPPSPRLDLTSPHRADLPLNHLPLPLGEPLRGE